MRWQSYQVMTSLQETLDRLAENPGLAQVVAGGTDLMVQIREMEAHEGTLTLLDISGVEEMRGISDAGTHIVIGAATTMAELIDSPLIQLKARALAQGAGWLGSPQIRNVATIGGNVVNARPAADTSVPLVALGAEAHIVSPDDQQDMAVEKIFVDVGKSAVNPSSEVITHFRVPLCEAPRQASAMQRLAKRKAFTLPQLSAAVRIELTEDSHRFDKVRIVVAPVSNVPWRAKRAEEALSGTETNFDNIARSAILAREDVTPRDSLRGSAEYRKEMVEVFVRRALLDALSQLNKAPYK